MLIILLILVPNRITPSMSVYLIYPNRIIFFNPLFKKNHLSSLLRILEIKGEEKKKKTLYLRDFYLFISPYCLPFVPPFTFTCSLHSAELTQINSLLNICPVLSQPCPMPCVFLTNTVLFIKPECLNFRRAYKDHLMKPFQNKSS